jgi:hypothetical protein
MKMIERWAMLVLAAGAIAACGRPGAIENQPAAATPDPEVTANGNGSAVPNPVGTEPLAYTSLKPADCRLLEENVDEGGYSRHRCDGIAGYALETSESDLRQDIVVISPEGARSELGLSGKVAKGAFNALGSAAEWRGANKDAPSALIVRLGVANGAEPNRPDTSNLVVVRLSAPACVVAVIPPGANQNAAARGAADKTAVECLKD